MTHDNTESASAIPPIQSDAETSCWVGFIDEDLEDLVKLDLYSLTIHPPVSTGYSTPVDNAKAAPDGAADCASLYEIDAHHCRVDRPK